MYDAGQDTVQEIADIFGVSRPTIYRHLAGARTPPVPAAPAQVPASKQPTPPRAQRP